MALVKETDYGKITISNEVFKEVIENACSVPECKGKIWLAPKHGIEAEYNEDGKVELKFSAVVKFGEPINRLCNAAADDVARRIKLRSGQMPASIKVNVVGVKSKGIAKRSMEVIREY
ncbi:MAG: Asp23/Gls24 family envelope stress response protein [Firmicutes bacterium]|nr:Asp23/Gls24 family envelope stress response protein [Bacillota bacterium]